MMSNLNEQIDRIKSIMGILTEETQGIEPFIERILIRYPELEPHIDKVKSFIENSNCKKIEVAKFKYPALGLALHNGVLFNETIFSHTLPSFLFIIFHEIAHQYQYKKYGDDKMYEFYLGNLDVKDAAIAMKEIEVIADELATRKVREFVKLGVAGENHYGMKAFYKNVPLSHFESLIKLAKKQIREMGVTDFDGVSTAFYNMVKVNE